MIKEPTEVTKDDKMEKRTKASSLMNKKDYKTLMKCFGKRMQRKKDNDKFSIDRYTKLCGTVLGDFGIGFKCIRSQKRENDKICCTYHYKLKESRQGVSILQSM